MWKDLKDIILKNKRFLLTSHVRPEGDSLGSEIALLWLLEKLGKEAVAVNSDEVPPKYCFLDPDGKIKRYREYKKAAESFSPDVVFILDASNYDRLGEVGDYVRGVNAVKVSIDHHPNQENMGDVKFVKEKAASTTELILSLIEEFGAKLEYPVAEAIYVGILTDTGGFRFSNTGPECHMGAAKLIDKGVRPDEVYSRLYEDFTWGKMKLLAQCLSTLKPECGGKVASFMITTQMLRETGVPKEDLEGLVDFARLIRDAEAVILYSEMDGGRTKVSLRSKGRIDVNAIARQFGGGGHRCAAGIITEDSVEKLNAKILREFENVL